MLTQAVQPILDRNAQINQFLKEYLKGDFERRIVAADASFRRYERVTHAEGTHILMDAPPEHEDTEPFVQVANYLHAVHLRAPAIYAADEARGFLLLEDFGSDSFTRYLQQHPQQEEALYRAAIDILVVLHQKRSAFRLPAYDRAVYQRELGILAEWYLPTQCNEAEKHTDMAREFHAIWEQLLDHYPLETHTPVLRDYHADNLMWQPDHAASDRVCLLDFQDALMGDGAYDLVSLLEDARRDVPRALAEKLIVYYCEQTAQDVEAFRLRYHLLGAQRNCKIIGIFNRLSQRDGKPHYLGYLPRVWEHLRHDLVHPALEPLRAWCRSYDI